MAAIAAFTCSTCGRLHEGSPSFSFPSPWHYLQLSDSERSNATLNSDTCTITHTDGTDYFVRVLLEIPIHGVDQPFLWGVWTSLSKASFDRYLATWDDPNETDSYFGWFCNRLPYYSDTLGLKTNVHPRKGGVRPYLTLERNGHVLAEHLADGISVQLAQKIAERVIHDG